MRPDILIIGAGVHGAAAARGLAERGASVRVLEQDTAGNGPTGRSSAICRSYYTDPFLAACARDSIDELATGSLSAQAGFHRTGGLYLHGPEDADAARELARELVAAGAGVQLIDPDGVGEIVFPDQAGADVQVAGVAMATWEPGAGYADPYLTTRALLDQAREHGAVVEERVRVRAVHPGATGVRVECADGSTRDAGRVLIAAGPWTAPLAATAGAVLPLTVERHTVLVYAAPAAACSPVFVADLPGGYYLRPEAGRLALVGGLLPGAPAEPDTVRTDISEEEQLALLAPVAARFPGVYDAAPRGGWASVYDVSPDWQPVIGQVAENVFVDAGTSGHGFKLAPALGRHVAALLLDSPDSRLARFSPDRFAAHRPLRAGFGDRRILG